MNQFQNNQSSGLPFGWLKAFLTAFLIMFISMWWGVNSQSLIHELTARVSASAELPVQLSDTEEKPISPLVGCDVVSLDFAFTPVGIDGSLTFSLVVGLPIELERYESSSWALTATSGGVNFYTKTITQNFEDGEPLNLLRDFKYIAENYLTNPALVTIDFTEIPIAGNVVLASPPNHNASLDRNLNNLLFSSGSFGAFRITGNDFSSNYPDFTPCAQNSLANTMIVSGNFNINTTMCIDQALNGTRYRILLTDDSKITVVGGGALSLINVDVSTCRDHLADGIIVSGGTLAATTSTFSGSKNGIRVNNFSSASITSCDFFNNQRGINLAGTPNVAMASRPLVSFSGVNRFFTTVVGGVESVVKNTITSPLTKYSRMEHGILANSAQPFTLTGASFTRVAKGIEAVRTDMTINGSTFINIHPNEDYAKGIAINSTFANFLRYNGTGAVPVSGVTFSDMYTGVLASFVGDLTVKNIQQMNLTTIGIQAIRLTNPTVHITDNWMMVRRTGILYRQNQPLLGDGFIANNNIRVYENPVSGACIALEGSPSTSKGNDNLWMEGNNLIMMDSRYGIKSLSSDNTIISNNDISIPNSNQQNRTCIQLEGSDNTNVDCNLMTRNDGGNNNDFETTVGLYSTGSANSMVSCNNSDDLLHGMQFFDMASNSHVQGNHFGNHFSSLVLGLPGNGDAFIGQQFDPVTDDGNGNVWDNFEDGLPNNNGILGAFHFSTSQLVWEKSKFKVNNVANTAFLPENIQNAWFPTNPNPAYTCSAASCPQGIPNDDKIGQLGRDIADGNLTPLGLDEGIVGKANLQLYRYLSANPTYVANYPGYATFMGAQANTNIGSFYQVEQGIQQLSALTTSEKTYFGDNRDNLNEALEEMATSSSATALATWQAQARTASENLQNLADQKTGQQANGIANLMALNASIPAVKTWELNLRTAYALYLKMLGSNSFSQTDSIALLNIANQCPTVGGDGVYVARSLFALLNDNLQFDDQSLCNNLGLRESKHSKSTEKVDLSVWPNPAMDKFQLKGLASEEFHYVLTNSLGVIVDQGKKTDGWFDIGTFTSGFYVLTVSQGEITRSIKFVISR